MYYYRLYLGHQPHISAAEITALFSRLGISYTEQASTEAYFSCSCEEPLDAPAIQELLGGTTMIRERVLEQVSGQDIAGFLEKKQPEGKIRFSLHAPKQEGIQIKKILKERGRSVRYIEPKNAATIVHNDLITRGGDLERDKEGLWMTIAVQSFEAFRERDFERPAADSKSGMLPPKLARIMVNLAGATEGSVFYDPFCGSGTTLVEALSLGVGTVYGSDISQKAVDDSRENTSWFIEDKEIDAVCHIDQHDITEPISFIEERQVTTIAAEPYMGVPLHGNERRETLEKQAHDLALLYTKAFQNMYPILADEATIIFIIPQFLHQKEWVVIDCLNDIKDIGYQIVPFSEEHASLLYHREGQHVGRMIWKLKKTV